jgi:cytochrome b
MSDLASTHNASAQAPPGEVQVWDPFVRFFHWSLASLVLVAFLTGDEAEALHNFVGYAIVALLAARIVWGFVGPGHARFADFVKSPDAIARYASDAMAGKAPRYLGHNPLGGAMAAALMAALLVVCWLGWQLTTDAHWGAEAYKEIHEVLAYGVLGMVGLHLLGVLWTSASHRENLIKAMVTGRKSA